MSLYDLQVQTLAGEKTTLRALAPEGAVLLVNVASRCGLTPQYARLEALHESIKDLAVIGVPCNQFGDQEPGTAEQIAEFCSATYGVTFPLLEKSDVNGPGRAPLFQTLVTVPDAEGEAGDVRWNFEKWLLSCRGEPVARFRSAVEPDDPALVWAIQQAIRNDSFPVKTP